MNKKIIIGSIITVVILILVSFTGVVGYQTTKSSTIAKASPLFSIRTQRALDRENKDLTSDYVGKGEETNIHLSSRMKRAEQVQKAISIISKMGDKSFSKFVARVILNMKNPEQMNDKETSDALQYLYYIRKNPNDNKYSDTENIHIDTTDSPTLCFWFPGCNIYWILEGILWIIFLIPIVIITRMLFTHLCYPSSEC